jgi:Homeodomain-like domain
VEPGVLVELGLVEQRYQAVREVLDGASVTVVRRRYAVVRQTVDEWLRRYAADGGLACFGGSFVASVVGPSASDAGGGRGAGAGVAGGASGVGSGADPLAA